MRMTSQDYRIESAADLEQILSHADFKREHLFFIPVISANDPARILGRHEHVIVVPRQGVSVLRYMAVHGTDSQDTEQLDLAVEQPEGTVYVLPTEYERIWSLLTFAGNDFLSNRLVPVLSRQKRAFPQFTLTNDDIKGILAGLDQGGPWEKLESWHAVLRPRGGGGKTQDHYHQRYEKLFALVDMKEALLERLRVVCIGPTELDFTLYRDGSVRIRSGQWAHFQRFLRHPILSRAADRLSLVAGRGRRSFQDLGRPLEVQLEQPVFRTPEGNSELVAALQSSGIGSVAVLHLNPYLHASMVDLINGASIDIFVTSPETVLVVPGYGANEGSLLRVLRTITDTICEGQVLDAEPSPRLSLADLAGVD